MNLSILEDESSSQNSFVIAGIDYPFLNHMVVKTSQLK